MEDRDPGGWRRPQSGLCPRAPGRGTLPGRGTRQARRLRDVARSWVAGHCPQSSVARSSTPFSYGRWPVLDGGLERPALVGGMWPALKGGEVKVTTAAWTIQGGSVRCGGVMRVWSSGRGGVTRSRASKQVWVATGSKRTACQADDNMAARLAGPPTQVSAPFGSRSRPTWCVVAGRAAGAWRGCSLARSWRVAWRVAASALAGGGWRRGAGRATGPPLENREGKDHGRDHARGLRGPGWVVGRVVVSKAAVVLDTVAHRSSGAKAGPVRCDAGALPRLPGQAWQCGTPHDGVDDGNVRLRPLHGGPIHQNVRLR